MAKWQLIFLPKFDSIFRYFRKLEQTDHLEAPRVSEQSPLPVHELVQPSGFLHGLQPWAISQVIGVTLKRTMFTVFLPEKYIEL